MRKRRKKKVRTTLKNISKSSHRRIKERKDADGTFAFIWDQSLPINLGTLESEATVKILSLVLACGVFSVVMVIAVAIHLLYFEEKDSTVRAVLQKKSRVANTDCSLVWQRESSNITLPRGIILEQLKRHFPKRAISQRTWLKGETIELLCWV